MRQVQGVSALQAAAEQLLRLRHPLPQRGQVRGPREPPEGGHRDAVHSYGDPSLRFAAKQRVRLVEGLTASITEAPIDLFEGYFNVRQKLDSREAKQQGYIKLDRYASRAFITENEAPSALFDSNVISPSYAVLCKLALATRATGVGN